MGQPQSICGRTVEASDIEAMIQLDLDPAARVRSITPISGTTSAPVLRAGLEGGQSFVLKVRQGEGLDAFDAEAHQLAYLAERSPLPVPRVLAHRSDGAAGPYTYLILSDLPGVPWARFHAFSGLDESARVQRDLGSLIGRLHRQCVAPAFAEIKPGACPSYRSWPELFSSLWQERIEGLLAGDRLDTQTLDAIEWIQRSLPRLLVTRDIPRLVHGNLGGTRILCAELDGELRVSGVLDPALAFAHREVDLALLELHCGVDESFFDGYREHIPIDPEYAERKNIYMLYFTLEDVRIHGRTDQILQVIDLVRTILRTAAA
jgi:fructosamine-3-kinase